MAEAVIKSYWGSYPPASVTPSGSPVVDVMQWNKDHTGLVKTGERNVQDEINAAAKGITPYEVFDRVARTGDESLLGEDNGFYGDASGAPETISKLIRWFRGGRPAGRSRQGCGRQSCGRQSCGRQSCGRQSCGGCRF